MWESYPGPAHAINHITNNHHFNMTNVAILCGVVTCNDSNENNTANGFKEI